jgi:hypothetical protein
MNLFNRFKTFAQQWSDSLMTAKTVAYAFPTSVIPAEITDPYFAWSLLGGATDYEMQQQFLVVYECVRGPVAAGSTEETEELISPLIAEFETKAAGLAISIHPIWWNDVFLYGTVTVNQQGLDLIRLMTASGAINRFEVSLMPKQMRSWRGFKQPKISAGNSSIPEATTAILYGVIDHGLPFAHPGLQCSSDAGSRILSAWYQEEECSPKQVTGYSGSAPNGFGFGNSLSSADLTTLHTSSRSEDWRKYASFGLPELRRDDSHGSHMLGDLLEAQRSSSLQWASFKNGNALNANPEYQLPVKPDTVFVQLPNAYIENLNRSAIGAYRLSAMRYILACAGGSNSSCKNVVIPISSEDYVGSHDGTSLFEKSVDAMIQFAKTKKKKDLMVFIASGNSLRMRTHEQMRVLKNATTSSSPVYQSTVRVFPSNELATYVEIWLDKAYDELDVEIAPRATIGGAISAVKVKLKKSEMSYYQDPTSTLKIVSVLNLHLQKQQMLLVRLPPSFSLDNSTPVLPSNNWDININSTKIGESIKAQAYIARSFHGLNGSLRSYQSRFLQKSKVKNNEPDDLLIDLPDYAKGSINGMANGQWVKVIGGYQLWFAGMTKYSDRRRAFYSSAGPARLGGRLVGTAVDALAPSDEGAVLRGIRHWNNRSAGTFRLAGSSVATPFAARAAARNGLRLPDTPAQADIDNPIDQDKIPFIDPLFNTP